jgi:hypothetical protein
VQRIRLVAGFERHIGAGIALEARPRQGLAEAQAVQRLPWEPTRLSLYRTIFPQLTLWLPEDEGAQLRFEFEMELARLETA